MKVHHRGNKKFPVFLSAALLASAVTTAPVNAEEVIYIYQEEYSFEEDCEELFDDGSSVLTTASEEIVYPVAGIQHDAGCGYREAQPEIPCDCNCADTDGDGMVDHCPECAYRPAVLEVPCTCGAGDGGSKSEEMIATPTPEPTITPTPTEIPEPTVTPIPTEMPELTVTPTPTGVPELTVTPTPTDIPKPTVTPTPTDIPEPTVTPTPVLTEVPEPTVTLIPVPTEVPEPRVTLIPTEVPELTVTPTPSPRPTVTPTPTDIPEPTETPVPTVTPTPTEVPEPTATPVPTDTPEPTVTPTPTDTPEPTVTPTPTDTPEPTVTPLPTEMPELTVTPTPAEEPEPTVPIPTIMPEPDDQTKEDENQEDAQASNEPAYTIDIPAQVMLNDSTSFTIRTVPSGTAEGGNVIVSVAGTESRDGQNFALYCGSSCWQYKLQTDSTDITPLQNSAVFSAGETERQVDVISIPGSSLCAGFYSGTLTFSVAYYEPELTVNLPEESAEPENEA